MGLIIFVIIGFLAQFVDGTAGMGYGAFSATILVGIGIAPVIASASIHTAEIFTTLFSGISHFKFGNVRKEWLLRLIIPGIVGGILGALLLSFISGNVMKPYVAGILLILGIIILFRFIRRRKQQVPYTKTSPKRMSILAFIAAFFDALGGGGWGPIATPGLILSENEEPRKVVGTVNLAEFFITIAEATTFFIILGIESYDWKMVGALLVGGIIAAPLAAFLCSRISARVLGIIVGVMLIVYNIRTILLLYL